MGDALTPGQRRLVEGALPIVDRVAGRLVDQVDLDLDELRGAGHEALVRAAMRFDPQSGVPFRAYAHYRVRGAMIDEARRRHRAGRQRRRAQVALETTRALLEHAADGTDERATLEQRVRAAERLVHRATASVLLTRCNARVEDQPGPDFERALLDEELRGRLRAEVAALSDEEREMVEFVYVGGNTMRALAKRSGTSPATISRRHARLMDKLAERLRSERPA